jgi:hypothetical protein
MHHVPFLHSRDDFHERFVTTQDRKVDGLGEVVMQLTNAHGECYVRCILAHSRGIVNLNALLHQQRVKS